MLREVGSTDLSDAAVAALAARSRGVGGWAAAGRRCRCAEQEDWRGSWRRSPAATGTSWTIWPRRCWSGRASRYAPSAGDLGAGTAVRPAVPRGHRPYRQPGAAGAGGAGRTVPGTAWMRCAAGGATTTLFADLLRARLQLQQPGQVRSCTITLRPGMSSTGWPTMRSGTPVAAGEMVLGRPADCTAVRRGLLPAR